MLREVRPAARLGISPFGLMKPSERPAGIQGFSQYDKLYADVELWLREGWLDYLVPQLYWPRTQQAQAFGPLLSAWMRLNPKGKPIWPGLFTSRVAPTNDGSPGWSLEEISGQIALSRELNPDGGHVHFSMVPLSQDRQGLKDHLAGAQSYAPPRPAHPALA